MAPSSLLLLRHLRRSPAIPSVLTSARSMGGGPRTFPGGLNKWQYKRMHEKLAKEKERNLLNQEKQLYQARLRSEIRANLSPSAPKADAQSRPSSFSPMSSKDHIKALADRFMKAGAEDLWNEDDGPISSLSKSNPPPPLDLRKIVKEGRNSVRNLEQRREYSTWRRNLSSSEDEGGDLIRRELKISRFVSGKGDDEEKEENEGGFGNGLVKKKMSFAALKNHDAKKKRRVPRVEDEEGDDFAEQIQRFRDEIRNRESAVGGNDRRKGYEMKQDSVLTQRR